MVEVRGIYILTQKKRNKQSGLSGQGKHTPKPSDRQDSAEVEAMNQHQPIYTFNLGCSILKKEGREAAFL